MRIDGCRRARLGVRTLLGICACILLGQAHAAGSQPAKWWTNAVIYEIYPRSFQDSNGDGVGDLNGIEQRLAYLEKLGVDAIWIAPMYPSPQVDFGYDISDYDNVDPQYGTLADFDRLLASARAHHIRILLDMVLNHTSDKHRWFIDAAASREDAKHDFYVWNNGRAGTSPPQPPNNWESFFGGSAWAYVPAVQQFYYHKFYRQQPDLNWRNPAVERAMFDAMRFWLDRGVAGFRLDAITTLFEDPQLRDEPVVGGTNAYGDPVLNDIYTSDMPEVHGVIKRMRAMVSRYPDDRVLIGETYLKNTAELDQWYGGARHDELQLPMDTQIGFTEKFDAAVIRRKLEELKTGIHGSQPLLVFDNHDNVRSIDRFGDGKHDVEIAKLIAALLLTTRDAALLYQGEELGQRTATPQRVEDVKDPIGISGWPKEKGRDGERTPMQWDLSNAQAGFSSNAKTWLPVTISYRTINVETEWKDPDSLLTWHKRLIELRRQAVAGHAQTEFLDRDNPKVLSYARMSPKGKALIVVLNISAEPQTVSLELDAAGVRGGQLKTLMSSPASMQHPTREKKIELAPYGTWIGTR